MAVNPDIFSVRKASPDSFESLFVREQTGHKNMLHLIHLRWMAVLGQILTIALSATVLKLELPVLPMCLVLVVLIAFNLASHLRWHEERTVSNQALALSLFVDFATLTLQLHFSGGLQNPFVVLHLLQIILAAVILRAGTAWQFLALTVIALATLWTFSIPLQIKPNAPYTLAELQQAGLVIALFLDAALLVFFTTRIGNNLRAGDAMLANLRQRAAEQDHILRMGLLASGAAHELGTPLSTLSVILGDWRGDAAIKDNELLQEDIDELEAQVHRIKTIVSQILMSAGETRGEGAHLSGVKDFLRETLMEWQAGRPSAQLTVKDLLDTDPRVAVDTTVRQMLFNLLDNAADASDKRITVRASLEADQLKLEVSDEGPGFPLEVLNQFGKPYNSTKGKPGGGLGLFLVVNVARTLGGQVRAENKPTGGAHVIVTLPLESLTTKEVKREQ